MAKCEMEIFDKSLHSHAATGCAISCFRCRTHQMEDGLFVDGMCSIGRIEDAVEKALLQIDEAKNK